MIISWERLVEWQGRQSVGTQMFQKIPCSSPQNGNRGGRGSGSDRDVTTITQGYNDNNSSSTKRKQRSRLCRYEQVKRKSPPASFLLVLLPPSLNLFNMSGSVCE
jgi:hypothetical protein